MKHLRLYIKLVFILLFFVFHSNTCKVLNKTIDTTTIEEDTVSTPGIVFLTYSIKNDTVTGEYSVRLINTIVTTGKIKVPDKITSKPGIDDLEYIVFDKDAHIIMRDFIPNPLNSTLEYVTSEGELAKKEVRLDSARFVLRIQLDPFVESVVLERYTGPDSRNIILLTTSL